jgi:hypothetical protein
MKRKLRYVIEQINLSRHIANHLAGERHTSHHRKIAGVLVMSFGVLVAKLSAIPEGPIIHFAGDLIGYGMHGIGLIPFATNIEKN